MMIKVLLLTLGAAAAAPALAAGFPSMARPAVAGVSNEVSDPYSSREIVRGQVDRADARLAASYARGDRSTELLLNLAATRMMSGDGAAARSLYNMVLAQPDTDMATPAGSAWSHAIATRGLSRIR